MSSEIRARSRAFARVPLATIPVPCRLVAASERLVRHKESLVDFRRTIAPEKDLHTWLQVARTVSLEQPETRFEIIGDGPEREQLEREAEGLGLGSVLSFAGFTAYDRLREIYARASALLLTSRGEGFGRVLVEAASQGTAAVSTALAGPRDIVINGVTGFLHEPATSPGLRTACRSSSDNRSGDDDGQSARTLVHGPDSIRQLRAAWVDLWITTARGKQVA